MAKGAITKGWAQFPRGVHVFVTLMVSIGLAAVMSFGPVAYLRRIAGGLEPFDTRLRGYEADEARTLLTALSQIGRDYYLNVQLGLDTVFPATYALAGALLLIWLTKPGRIANRPLPPTARAALALLPFITAGCDYMENDFIAKMLTVGPAVSGEMVASASFWTQAKWLAALITVSLSMVMSALAVIRWWRRRRSAA